MLRWKPDKDMRTELFLCRGTMGGLSVIPCVQTVFTKHARKARLLLECSWNVYYLLPITQFHNELILSENAETCDSKLYNLSRVFSPQSWSVSHLDQDVQYTNFFEEHLVFHGDQKYFLGRCNNKTCFDVKILLYTGDDVLLGFRRTLMWSFSS